MLIAPSRKMGGIERALTVLANEWVDQGISVIYISCLKSTPFYKLSSKVQVIEPEFIRAKSILNKVLFYLKLLIFIRNNVMKYSPDRVVVFGDYFNPITLLALMNTSFPIYISDRTIPDYPFKFPIPQLKRWLYPKSYGFIAQTKRAKEYKVKLFNNKLNIKVIPNALANLNYLSLTNCPVKSNTILYVGRFEWEKDPEILIRAFHLFQFKHQGWKLEMAGSGPLLNKMRLLSIDLGISDKVVFHGDIQEIEKLYSFASVFVLPSKIEGFPNALIEAMSFGLPCICFSDIPHEDIVNHNVSGIVVQTRNEKSLYESLEIIVNNPQLSLKIGEEAKKHVESNFSSKKIAKDFLSFMKIYSNK